MSRVKVALASTIALTVVAIAVTLAQSPVAVIASNGVGLEANLLETQQGARLCQRGETIPAGTSALRFAAAAEIGPRVSVTVRAGGGVLTHGARGDGWGGGSVTIPVARVSRATPGAEVCFAFADPLEAVAVRGGPTGAATALSSTVKPSTVGRMQIEYLRRGPVSWLSQVSAIGWRMGLGHALPGSWIVFALLAAMTSCAVLVSRLLLRELA